LASFPDYVLVVDYDSDGRLEYHIVNKKTKVVELQTKFYPQALAFIEQLQGMLDAIRDESLDAAEARIRAKAGAASFTGEACH
jgi:hypothetical protein